MEVYASKFPGRCPASRACAPSGVSAEMLRESNRPGHGPTETDEQLEQSLPADLLAVDPAPALSGGPASPAGPPGPKSDASYPASARWADPSTVTRRSTSGFVGATGAPSRSALVRAGRARDDNHDPARVALSSPSPSTRSSSGRTGARWPAGCGGTGVSRPAVALHPARRRSSLR